MESDDALLRRLLAEPVSPADDFFVLKVRNAVAAEETLRLARRSAWRRLAIELAGTAAVLLAFILLARQAPELENGLIAPLGPAAVGLLLIALWQAVTSRSESSAT